MEFDMSQIAGNGILHPGLHFIMLGTERRTLDATACHTPVSFSDSSTLIIKLLL